MQQHNTYFAPNDVEPGMNVAWPQVAEMNYFPNSLNFGSLPNQDPSSYYNHAFNSRLPDVNADDQRGTDQNLLENIPLVDIPKQDTPNGLKCPLYDHQKIALAWLKRMEQGNYKGGILADDMGLGKTISTLALILSRPSKDMQRKV